MGRRGDAGAARLYLTMDGWESRQAYEEFRAKHGAEYAALDKQCEDLTEMERHVVCYEG
jgi:hypothetical protein